MLSFNRSVLNNNRNAKAATTAKKIFESGPAAVELLFGSKPAIARHQKMMAARPNMSKYRSSAQWKLYGPYLSGKGVMGERTHELELGDTELEGIEILASKLVSCLA